MKRIMPVITLALALVLALSSCELLGSLFGFTGVSIEVSGDSTHYSDETIYFDAVLEGVDPEDYGDYEFRWYKNGSPQDIFGPSIKYKDLVVSGDVSYDIGVEVENSSGKVREDSVRITIKASGSLRVQNLYSQPIWYLRLNGGDDILGQASIASDGPVFVIYNVNGTQDVQVETQGGVIRNWPAVYFPYGLPQRITLNADGTTAGPVDDTVYYPSVVEPLGVFLPAVGANRPAQLNASAFAAR